MEVTLTLTIEQHEHLKKHLFPGDGCEAVAVILCGRRAGDRRHRLVAREVHPIPYDWCSERTPVRVTWSTDVIVPLLDLAEKDELTVVKIHSHPNGRARFSGTDDEGDNRFIPTIRDWFEKKFSTVASSCFPMERCSVVILLGTVTSCPWHISMWLETTFYFGIPIQTKNLPRLSWLRTPKHLAKAPLSLFAIFR